MIRKKSNFKFSTACVDKNNYQPSTSENSYKLSDKSNKKDSFLGLKNNKNNPSLEIQALLKRDFNNNNNKDNPVLNRIQPRQLPGLDMIHCLENDWRYYGESSNVSGRLASHKSLLNRNIHPNFSLQYDCNTYGPDKFQFVVLHLGNQWENSAVRRGKELEYIIQNRNQVYNVLEGISKPGDKNPFWGKTHSEETKKKIGDAMRGIPNEKLGKKVSIKGIQYPSVAEASRQTGHSRKLIRNRIHDSNFSDWYEI